MFQLSVDSHRVPILWKTSYILLLTKKTCPKENNGYIPVALTSILMKCLERLVACKLKLDVQDYLDPFQFYRQGRGTDDGVNTLVHLILKHLDKPTTYVRLLFIDFSSAFNVIQPHTLNNQLKEMNVNPYIIKGYHSFLTNTGAPQDCVSSPIVYTLYTNDCTSSSTNNYMIQCSDNSAILSLLHAESDISMYTSEIESFVHWCDSNHLKLNISKSQEVIFDIKCIVADHLPVVIHSEKYLSVHLDNKVLVLIKKYLFCFANSDHDSVHLIPTYRPVLKRSKPMLKTVNMWSVDNVEKLKDCFMCTDWEVFTQDNPDINTATYSVTYYIMFCRETVIPNSK